MLLRAAAVTAVVTLTLAVTSAAALAVRTVGQSCISSYTADHGTLTLCSSGTQPSDYTVPGIAEALPVCYYGDGITPTAMRALWHGMDQGIGAELPEHPTLQEITAHVTPRDTGLYYAQVCAPNLSGENDLTELETAWTSSHDEFKYFPNDTDTEVLDPGKLAEQAKLTLTLPKATVSLTPATRSIVNAPTTVTFDYTGDPPGRTLTLQSPTGETLSGTVTATPYQLWIVPGADYGTDLAGHPVFSQTCPADTPVAFNGGNTASCQVTFTRSSARDGQPVPYQLTVEVVWRYHYQVSAGAAPADDLSPPIPSDPVAVTVMDIETLVVP